MYIRGQIRGGLEFSVGGSVPETDKCTFMAGDTGGNKTEKGCTARDGAWEFSSTQIRRLAPRNWRIR